MTLASPNGGGGTGGGARCPSQNNRAACRTNTASTVYSQRRRVHRAGAEACLLGICGVAITSHA